MPDYKQFASTPSSPIRRSVVVTPNDSGTIEPTKGLLIVSGGTVVIRCSEDVAPQSFPDLPAYSTIYAEVVLVMATGTTATHIKALY